MHRGGGGLGSVKSAGLCGFYTCFTSCWPIHPLRLHGVSFRVACLRAACGALEFAHCCYDIPQNSSGAYSLHPVLTHVFLPPFLNLLPVLLPPLQVLLLSARDALTSRLILSGRSDAANTQRFCRIAFGAYNPRYMLSRFFACSCALHLPFLASLSLSEVESVDS